MRIPCPEAVASARRVRTEAGVRSPWHIDIEAIAAMNGVYIRYVKLDTARACIMRTSKVGVVNIDEALKGTPEACWTGAHEIGHHVHDAVIDHFRQCEGGERKYEDFEVERRANSFAGELTMPEEWTAPLCAMPRPTLDDVARVARRGVPFEAAALRMVELAEGPCALSLFAKNKRGVWCVQWGPETETFPGRVFLRRAPHPRSMAAEMIRTGGRRDRGPREVPPEAWAEETKGKASRKGTPPFVEHAVWLGSKVLSWILPAI